jgi:hypothetical protein
MVRIELRGRDGRVHALQIPAGVELAPEVGNDGEDVIHVRDARGHTLAEFRWSQMLSAAVERALALPPAA